MRQRGFTLIAIIVAVLAVLMIGGGAYYLSKQSTTNIQPVLHGNGQGPVVKPSPTQTVVDQTANWQTYNNPYQSLTFKYPPDFAIQHGSGFLTYPSDDHVISISYTGSSEPIQQWITDKNICPAFINNGNSCSFQVAGPISGSVQFDTLGRHYASTETIFEHNGIIIDVSLGATKPDTPISSDAKQLYNRILSTVTFTNQTQSTGTTDTSSWKTYTNNPYGYAFNYPSTWTTPQIEVTNDTGSPLYVTQQSVITHGPLGPAVGSITVSVYRNPNKLDTVNWLNTVRTPAAVQYEKPGTLYGQPIPATPNSILGGQQAVRIDRPGGQASPATILYAGNNMYIYEVTVSLDTPTLFDQVYDPMFASFKFIN